jgi:hypothetical protein
MPHINDLSQNKVIEGNDGDKWIVSGSTTQTDEILLTLKRLKVEEVLEITNE